MIISSVKSDAYGITTRWILQSGAWLDWLGWAWALNHSKSMSERFAEIWNLRHVGRVFWETICMTVDNCSNFSDKRPGKTLFDGTLIEQQIPPDLSSS